MENFRSEMRAFADSMYPGENRRLVFGVGPMCPGLMLIGEAPGGQEEQAGRPFVGKAGQNLNEMLAACHLTREEIYIANAVKFRPTKISKAGRVVNRPPTQKEIDTFRPWLMREIALVKPNMIATLGGVPLRSLTGRAISIGDVHGRLMHENGMVIFPMYHPASMIYNRALKDVFECDLRALAQLVIRASF